MLTLTSSTIVRGKLLSRLTVFAASPNLGETTYATGPVTLSNKEGRVVCDGVAGRGRQHKHYKGRSPVGPRPDTGERLV